MNSWYVLSDCELSILGDQRGGIQTSELMVDMEDLCRTMGGIDFLVSTSDQMFVFRFYLPKEAWNSIVTFSLSEDSGKVVKRKFDLSKLK